jgi:hypothetical protein
LGTAWVSWLDLEQPAVCVILNLLLQLHLVYLSQHKFCYGPRLFNYDKVWKAELNKPLWILWDLD